MDKHSATKKEAHKILSLKINKRHHTNNKITFLSDERQKNFKFDKISHEMTTKKKYFVKNEMKYLSIFTVLLYWKKQRE